MSEGSLIMQSINLTIIGMVVVFVFLIFMIAIMKILAKAVAVMEKYFPQATPAKQNSAISDNAAVAAAIACAKRFLGN